MYSALFIVPWFPLSLSGLLLYEVAMMQRVVHPCLLLTLSYGLQ